MSKKGQIRRMDGTKVQVFGEGNRPYQKFNDTLLPEGVKKALDGAKGPQDVLFHVDVQQQYVQGEDCKYLIWLPGEEEPAMPVPRPAGQQPVQTPAHRRNDGSIVPHDAGPRPRQPADDNERPTPHNIDRVREHRNTANKIEELTIIFHPEMTVKIAGQDQQVTTKKNTHFQVTDPSLAFRQDTQFSKAKTGENPGLAVTTFAPDAELPLGVRGTVPDIDRNPYNFVSLPGNKPWLYERDHHPHHDKWLPGHYSGVLEFAATAETPLFVPEGFPFSPTGNTEIDALRAISRRFCRMNKADGKTCYAVPGSTVKGVVRSGIEALSNSRMGVLNQSYYKKPIPYRRRCYNDMRRGQIHTGIVETANSTGGYTVRKIKETYIHRNDLAHFQGIWDGGATPTKTFTYDEQQRTGRFLAVPGTSCSAGSNDVFPYTANLMNALNKNHDYTHRIVTRYPETIPLPAGAVQRYHDKLLDHPHLEAHWKEYLKNPPANPGQNKPKYTSAVPEFKTAIKALRLGVGDIIYFTDDGSKITSFGKNVNYLWPADHSIQGLIGDYFLPDDLGLGMELSMAECLFGFAGRHRKTGENISSHPFRSRLRFETLWGPEVDANEDAWTDHHEANKAGFKVKLAVLTSPQARAKARPLYLEPRPGDKRSASYSDEAPVMRGRKFYWHQKAEDADGIWSIHKRHPYHDLIEKQLPPEIRPLNTGTTFTGRIHFDNLTGEELGALLYSLAGDGSYRHGIKLGKGKPRGLGSLSIVINKLTIFAPQKRYKSLTKPSDGEDVKENDALSEAVKDKIDKFKDWCKTKNGTQTFEEQDHIKDYKKLHTLPAAPSARYYPLNFRQYSWLPKENKDPDEPKSPANRPKAMKLARDI